MDINYELYKLIFKVAKSASFTKVAEDNYISQSAVTQAMKKLENQLGGTLFIRSKQGVTLTPEGQTLYEYLCNSLETLNSAENLFSKYQNLEKGELRINCGYTLMDIALMKPLLRFSKDYPNVQISVGNDKSIESLGMIANGKLDLSLLMLPVKNEYDNVKVEELKDADMCFFTNKKFYKKLEKKKIDINTINEYPLALPIKGTNARSWLNENFKNLKVNLDACYAFSSGKILVDFVKNSEVIGYANKEIVLNNMGDDAVILANDFNIERKEVGIAYLNEKITSAAVKKFVEYLKEDNK